MNYFKKILLAVLLLVLSLPSKAANELIEGVRNEYTLMYALAIGSALLLVCLLTLMYMLAKAFPMLLKKHIATKTIRQDQNQ